METNDLTRMSPVIGKRLTLSELRVRLQLYPEADYWRPRTRADCVDAPRPCPYVGCRYHLYLNVSRRTGAARRNFPDRDVSEMADSCSLDVADRGGATLEEVAKALNLTREQVRTIELRALAKTILLDFDRKAVPIPRTRPHLVGLPQLHAIRQKLRLPPQEDSRDKN